jgi:hypothetical protein
MRPWKVYIREACVVWNICHPRRKDFPSGGKVAEMPSPLAQQAATRQCPQAVADKNTETCDFQKHRPLR